MNEAIERLEVKIAFLEATNNELSDVLYRQQQELDALRGRLKSLADRFDEFQNKPREWAAADEKPPHY